MGNKTQHPHRITKGNKLNFRQVKPDTLMDRMIILYKDQEADSQVTHAVQVIKFMNQLTTVNHMCHNQSPPLIMIPSFNYQDPKIVDHPQHHVRVKIFIALVMIYPNRRALKRFQTGVQAKTTSQSQTSWERQTTISHPTQPPQMSSISTQMTDPKPKQRKQERCKPSRTRTWRTRRTR